jgi:hypothetical protein
MFKKERSSNRAMLLKRMYVTLTSAESSWGFGVLANKAMATAAREKVRSRTSMPIHVKATFALVYRRQYTSSSPILTAIADLSFLQAMFRINCSILTRRE